MDSTIFSFTWNSKVAVQGCSLFAVGLILYKTLDKLQFENDEVVNVTQTLFSNIFPKQAQITAKIPFTARITAYHRYLETTNKKAKPLIKDPFAQELSNLDAEYVDKHLATLGKSDYTAVRDHYIDNNLLLPFININNNKNTRKTKQIVILGAGLDTRAYTLKFKENNPNYSYNLFELDFESTILYKANILDKYKKSDLKVDKLVRIACDFNQVSKNGMKKLLLKYGFKTDCDTFWLMEGLLMYLEEDEIFKILNTIGELSLVHKKENKLKENQVMTQFFFDAFEARLKQWKFGPFAKHWRWWIEISKVNDFLCDNTCLTPENGWKFEINHRYKFAMGRELSEKTCIFCHGTNV